MQGPKGKLSQPVPPGITFELEDGEICRERRANDARAARVPRPGARAGRQRRQGRDRGLQQELDIVGVGYRAAVKGSKVVFALGYSHPVVFPIPQGIKIAIEKQTRVTVTGIDRQRVGQVAAEIRGAAQAGPVQAEGHPLRGRGAEEEGRQGRARK